MSEIAERILSMKKALEEAQKVKHQAEGRIQSAMADLKKLDLDSIQAAEKLGDSLEAEIKQDDEALEKQLTTLEKQYDWGEYDHHRTA